MHVEHHARNALSIGNLVPVVTVRGYGCPCVGIYRTAGVGRVGIHRTPGMVVGQSAVVGRLRYDVVGVSCVRGVCSVRDVGRMG